MPRSSRKCNEKVVLRQACCDPDQHPGRIPHFRRSTKTSLAALWTWPNAASPNLPSSLNPSSFIIHHSSFILHPSSFIPQSSVLSTQSSLLSLEPQDCAIPLAHRTHNELQDRQDCLNNALAMGQGPSYGVEARAAYRGSQSARSMPPLDSSTARAITSSTPRRSRRAAALGNFRSSRRRSMKYTRSSRP